MYVYVYAQVRCAAFGLSWVGSLALEALFGGAWCGVWLVLWVVGWLVG